MAGVFLLSAERWQAGSGICVLVCVSTRVSLCIFFSGYSCDSMLLLCGFEKYIITLSLITHPFLLKLLENHAGLSYCKILSFQYWFVHFSVTLTLFSDSVIAGRSSLIVF